MHVIHFWREIGKYCDIPLGLYVVRGDNIVLLGELDASRETTDMNLEVIEPENLAEYPNMYEDRLDWDFE